MKNNNRQQFRHQMHQIHQPHTLFFPFVSKLSISTKQRLLPKSSQTSKTCDSNTHLSHKATAMTCQSNDSLSQVGCMLNVKCKFVMLIVEADKSIRIQGGSEYLYRHWSNKLVISRNLMKRARFDDLKVCSSLTDPFICLFAKMPSLFYLSPSYVLAASAHKTQQPPTQKLLKHIQKLIQKSNAIIEPIMSQRSIYSAVLLQVGLMQTEASVQMIRHLLQKMAGEQVAAAQSTMKQMVTHPDFFTAIYFILSGQEQQRVKTIAASFLNSRFIETVSEENLEVVYEVLVRILAIDGLKDIDKRLFERSIIRCLQLSTLEQAEKWLYFVEQCLQNIRFYDPALLIISSLAVSDFPISLMQKTITQTYEPILANLTVTIQQRNLLSETLKAWIIVIDRLAQEKKMRQLMEGMISSPNLFRVIGLIYQMGGEFLCGGQGRGQLNLLKFEATELHKKMLEIELKKAGEGLDSIVNFTRPFLPKFAQTLTKVSSKHKTEFSTNQDLTTNLLSLTRLYLGLRPQEFTLEDAISFQNKIIFPLLLADQTQIEKFQLNSEDFNALAEDCCDKQIFGVVKTEAAKLLQFLGDKVQGSCHYAFSRALESISIKFGYVQAYKTKEHHILQLETAFLVLSIFSYEFSNFPGIASEICRILSDERARALPPLELARVFTFLAYNYFEVFKEPKEGEIWLQLAINYEKHPTTRYCAFDCFSNIIEEHFNEKFLPKICEQIQAGQKGLIWQIIGKILSLHFNQLSHSGLLMLASQLFSRIENELSILKTGQKNTLDIINCLRTFANMLKQARKESAQNAERKHFVMAAVWPILDFYQQSRQLDIEDEVVKIAIQLINAMDTLSPEIFKHINDYIAVFSNQDSNYSDKIYFRLLNQLIMKGEVGRDGEELGRVLLVVKQAALNAFNKLYDGRGRKLKPIPHYRLALSNALIVLQNAIAILGTQLLQAGNYQFFQQLTSLCLQILPHQTSEIIERTSSGYIILSRTLNTLLLCHMHLPAEQFYVCLERLKHEKLYHGYDAHVLVMCVARQAFQEGDIAAIVLLVEAMARFVENSASKNETLEKNRKKKYNSVKISHQMRKIEDFDKIIAVIDSPFKNEKDATSLMVEIFAQMKTSSPQLFSALLQALPSEQLHYLNGLVDFDNVQKKKRVYRKVIGIKMGVSQIQPRPNQRQEGQEGEMGESEEELGLKRRRTKLKKQDKNKKVIRIQKKRQHIEDE